MSMYSFRDDVRAAPPTPLGPLLAGARVRGVADGFDWLGLAAILVDDRGEALHLSAGAAELMGDVLYLEDRRLRARDPLADFELAQAMRAILAGGRASTFDLGPGKELTLHVAPVSVDDENPYQLLRAVIFLRPGLACASAR